MNSVISLLGIVLGLALLVLLMLRRAGNGVGVWLGIAFRVLVILVARGALVHAVRRLRRT